MWSDCERWFSLSWEMGRGRHKRPACRVLKAADTGAWEAQTRIADNPGNGWFGELRIIHVLLRLYLVLCSLHQLWDKHFPSSPWLQPLCCKFNFSWATIVFVLLSSMFYLLVVSVLTPNFNPGGVNLLRLLTFFRFCFIVFYFFKKQNVNINSVRSLWVRNIIYCIPKVAKWCWDGFACSLFRNILEMPLCMLIFLFSAYRAKWSSLFLLIFGESSRGRKNSFGIFWREQEYNLAFVWWKCGKFQFPNVCAGGSKLNFETGFLGPQPRGGRGHWQGLSCLGKLAGNPCWKVQLLVPSWASRDTDLCWKRTPLCQLYPKNRKHNQGKKTSPTRWTP